MNMPRSTCYEVPTTQPDDSDVVAMITAITDEFECGQIRLTVRSSGNFYTISAFQAWQQVSTIAA